MPFVSCSVVPLPCQHFTRFTKWPVGCLACRLCEAQRAKWKAQKEIADGQGPNVSSSSASSCEPKAGLKRSKICAEHQDASLFLDRKNNKSPNFKRVEESFPCSGFSGFSQSSVFFLSMHCILHCIVHLLFQETLLGQFSVKSQDLAFDM